MPKVKRNEELDKDETLLGSTEKEIHRPDAFLHLSRSERLRSLLFLVSPFAAKGFYETSHWQQFFNYNDQKDKSLYAEFRMETVLCSCG